MHTNHCSTPTRVGCCSVAATFFSENGTTCFPPSLAVSFCRGSVLFSFIFVYSRFIPRCCTELRIREIRNFASEIHSGKLLRSVGPILPEGPSTALGNETNLFTRIFVTSLIYKSRPVFVSTTDDDTFRRTCPLRLSCN